MSTGTAAPPTKRQKTDNRWAVGVDVGKPLSGSQYLPEISLDLDGSYGVLRNASKASALPSITPKPPSTASLSTKAPVNRPSVSGARPAPAGAHAAPPLMTFRPASASGVHQSYSRPPSGSQNRPVGFHRSNSRTAIHAALNNHTVVAPVISPRLLSPSTNVSSQDNPSYQLERQLQELHQKLEQLQVSEENKKIQSALKEAVGARMAKEGEVTVLRKNAEKTQVSREHALQLSKMKAAREEAEAKQARMQKEMREEVERLKTNLIFKQHENESSRKPTHTRAKKMFKEPPSGLTPTPSQPSWSTQVIAPGSRDHIEATPTPRRSLANIRDHDLRTSPQNQKITMLPGFQNAFSNHTPLRSRPLLESGNPERFSPFESLQRQYTDFVSPTRQRNSQRNVDTEVRMDGPAQETFFEANHIMDHDGDIDMPIENVNEIDGEDDFETEEDAFSIQPPDWKAEVVDDQTLDSHILVSLCGIILDLREIDKDSAHEFLATEIVTLLESLSLTADLDLVDKYVNTPQP
ncbi:hypothetical protein H0H81_009511 [Sphagnurus paluster]|uniref:Uncharacterized protein n=1 Tax=Sphagnurus paluster TaxID=117069 RepID=A0A9P7GQC8_9AGAR|nr:hypothetical protein H0H81_009511 [Sphagnurus paluster]